jgi:hypothetical protein
MPSRPFVPPTPRRRQSRAARRFSYRPRLELLMHGLSEHETPLRDGGMDSFAQTQGVWSLPYVRQRALISMKE